MDAEEYKAMKDSPDYEVGQEPSDSDVSPTGFEDILSSAPMISEEEYNQSIGNVPDSTPSSISTPSSSDPFSASPTANPFSPTPSYMDPFGTPVGMGTPGQVGMPIGGQDSSPNQGLKQQLASNFIQAGQAGVDILKQPEQFSDKKFLHSYAKWVLTSGIFITLLSVVAFIISLFTGLLQNIPSLFFSGLTCFALGLAVDTFVPEPDKEESTQQTPTESNNDYYSGYNHDDENTTADSTNDDSELFPFPTPVDDDDTEEDEIPDDSIEDEDNVTTPEDGKSNNSNDIDWNSVVVPEASVDDLPDIQSGTQTRQYLYEAMKRVLPKITPKFDEKTEYEENSPEFDEWGLRVANTAELLNMHPESVLLQSCYETSQVIKLRISREAGTSSRDKRFEEELLNTYKVNDDGVDIHPTATATHVVSGSNYYLTISKGVSPEVSIADVMDQCEDYLLDPKITRPWLIGVGKEGQIYKADLANINSMIIAGRPRSGKSWSIEELLFFMCWFTSPKETNIHIYDVKEGASSYLGFKLPHVKKLVSNVNDVFDDLHWVFDVEAKRRQEIFKENKVSKIQDLYEIDPSMTEKVPYLYLVVEEMIGLKSKMDSDQVSSWNEMQASLVTQLPAYGIFAIFVPHRIINDVISKTTSRNIPVQFVYKMDEEGINESLGVNRKQFPYKLDSMGDAGAKIDGINGSSPFFVHSLVVTDSNFNNTKVYKYLANLWKKLCPDSYGYYEKNEDMPVSNIDTEDANIINIAASDVSTEVPSIAFNSSTVINKGSKASAKSTIDSSSADKGAHWAPVKKDTSDDEDLPEDFWNNLIDNGN